MSRSMPSASFFRAIRRGLADEHRCARHGREDGVRQRGLAAARPDIRFEFGEIVGADLQGPLAAFDVELDRRALDRDHGADQLRQFGHRTAGLAGVDLQQRVLLRLRGFVVDEDRGAPVALEDVAGDMRGSGDRHAGHVDSIDRAFVHAPRHDGVAGAVVGVLADPAGTQDVAIADFQQTTFEVIAHLTLRQNNSPIHAASAAWRNRCYAPSLQRGYRRVAPRRAGCRSPERRPLAGDRRGCMRKSTL